MSSVSSYPTTISRIPFQSWSSLCPPLPFVPTLSPLPIASTNRSSEFCFRPFAFETAVFSFTPPSSDFSTCAKSPQLLCFDVTTSDVSSSLESVRTALLFPTSLSFQLKILGMRLRVLTCAFCSFLQPRLSIPRIRPVPSLRLAACKSANSLSVTSELRSLLSLAPGEFASDRMLVFITANRWDGSWLLVAGNHASLSCNSVSKTEQHSVVRANLQCSTSLH